MDNSLLPGENIGEFSCSPAASIVGGVLRYGGAGELLVCSCVASFRGEAFRKTIYPATHLLAFSEQ
ncbi:MAG: hypothetical protein GYB31_14275 [Bacteroidetes bacterium]|nr:hypothetical protein [Bacteroidota bacterium]